MKYILKKIIAYSPFKIAIISFFSCFVFINIFLSSQYSTEVIFDVSEDENSFVDQSFIGSFIGDSSSKPYQIKSFLESKEASTIFYQSTFEEEIFNNNNIRYFSRYNANFLNKSFHDYYLSKFDISIDPDSNTLSIKTFAFSPQDSYRNNLRILNMTYDFLSRTAQVASHNSKINKICNLYFISTDVLNGDLEKHTSEVKINTLTSANELLLKKAQNFKDFCMLKLANKSNSLNIDTEIFPTSEIRSISSDVSKKILAEIYDDSISSFASENEIKIIAEPVIPTHPESKRSLLLSTLLFLCLLTIHTSLKIVLRLSEEFNIK